MDNKQVTCDLELVRLAVREEIGKYNHVCKFNVLDEDVVQFGRFIGMTQELGRGKIARGVEVMRDNHTWIYKARKRGERIGSIFMAVFISTVFGGVLYAIWHGVVTLMGK